MEEPMTKPSLEDLLHSGEWTGAEFKATQEGLPKSAFETVSAFANTRGGWIVLGVTQDGERFEVSGVDETRQSAERLLVGAARRPARSATTSTSTEHRFRARRQGGARISTSRRIRAPRKPVYLDGDIRRTFPAQGRPATTEPSRTRSSACCATQSADRWDGQPFTRVDLDEVFHPASLKWYRDRFHATNPGFDVGAAPPRVPLRLGLPREGERQAFLPTRASVALFGSLRGVRNLTAAPDPRRAGSSATAAREDLPQTRWIDRFVSEVNIVETWQQLARKVPVLHAQDRSGTSTRPRSSGATRPQAFASSARRR
jgi:ATP-dependent DNA helicase RecG